MKKIFYACLLLGWLLCANSCYNSEYDYDNLFPKEYAKILSVKNSETVIQTMSSLDETSVYDMIILKGGYQPSEVSSATIMTWSDEELKEYSTYNGLNCQIIPSSTYLLSNSEIYFAQGERAKHVLVHFKPLELAKEMSNNLDITYLLPLKLISKDSVMSNKKEVIIQIDMHIPTVSLSEMPSDIVRVENKEQIVALQANLTMSEYDLGDFKCPMAYAGDEYVLRYNENMGTEHYLPLPESAYELDEISFKSGDESSSISVVIHKDMLEENQFYVLPVKVGSPTNNDVIADNVVYYIPIFNPAHVYISEDCDRSNWEVLFCNSDDIGSGNAGVLLDDDTETFWHSAWQGGFCDSYEDCYDYDKTMGRTYEVCLGRRNLPITIVFDMKEPVWVHSLGIVQRSGPNNRYIKGVEFYVSDEDEFIFSPMREGGDLDDYSNVALNNWRKIYSDISIPQDGGVIWRQVPDGNLGEEIRGRLLKIKFTETYHGSKDVISMAELYVKRVSKVDGVPVK